jgi:RNA polymerase sigma factor (sigma-70 family)
MTDFLDYILAVKRDGASSGFQGLLQLFEHKVFTMCYRIIGNREEAEEAAQDVFLKCFRSLDKLDDESKFPQWLMKIAYSKAIDYVRKKKVEKVDFDEINEISGDVNSIRIGNLEHSDVLEQSLLSLNSQSRAIINLFYQEDMPVKEIALFLDLSESNVKIQLHRSRIEIRKILESKLNVEPSKLI